MNESTQPSQDPEVTAQRERYELNLRRMQTGVAMMIEHTPPGRRLPQVEPKHLRVGVNSALCDASSIATLLLAKGIITELELYTSLADGAEAEANRYEKDVSDLIGTPVKLGAAGSFGS